MCSLGVKRQSLTRNESCLCNEKIYIWITLVDNNLDTDTTTIIEFEDIKGVIRIRISKKNRQHNGQNKKYKRINNDQQNIHIKLKIE
jgi:hypothetical protein